eukprot:gene14902-6041_t
MEESSGTNNFWSTWSGKRSFRTLAEHTGTQSSRGGSVKYATGVEGVEGRRAGRAGGNREKNKLSKRRFDIEKLKDPEVAESYQEELAGKFAPLLLLDQDPQDLCDVFTDTLEKTVEEKLGKARPIKKPWITPEVLEACDVRRDKRRRRHLGANDLLEYRVANRKVRNEINIAKNKWIISQAQDIEENLRRNNTKKAYETVKKLCGSYMDETKRKQAGIIEDKDGTLLTKSDDICRRWKNYCEELFNCNIQKDQEVLKEQVTEERQEEVTMLMSE